MVEKHIAVKVKDKKRNKEILELAEKFGFRNITPKQKTGEYIDVLCTKDGNIVGYDIVTRDSLRNAWTTYYNATDEELITAIKNLNNDS